MKRNYITLIAGLFACIASHAQNTAWPLSTSSDNVGIGTTNPQAKFHLYNGKLVIEQVNMSGSKFASLFLQTDDSFGVRTKTGIMATGSGSWGVSDLNFVVNGNNDNSSATIADTRLIIKASGNVGIGTMAPQSALDVNGGIRTQGESQFTLGSYVDPHAGIGYAIKVGARGIAVNGNSAFLDGNVGVGTTDTKGYKLAVAGNIISESVTVSFNLNGQTTFSNLLTGYHLSHQ